MKFLVIAALAAVAVADVSRLPKRRSPQSSYDVAQNSVTGSFYYPTTPSPALHLPIHHHQDFRALVTNFGESGYSTPVQYSTTTVAPPLAFGQQVVSSTPAPNLEVYSPSAVGSEGAGFNAGFHSTPAPSLQLHSGFGGAAPAYGDFSNIFQGSNAYPGSNLYAGSNVYPGYGLGNPYSTAAPAYSFGQSVDTSGGSLSDAFGVSTPGPLLSEQAFSQEAFIQHPQPELEVTKHVFFYSAPEEEVSRPRINVIQPATRKNVKVIFVKAPVQQVSPVVKIAAPQPQEDKTLVYVLVKKPEETHQVIELQTQPPTPAPKPEVYFIKYKNQQEAEAAISRVQAGQHSAEGHVLGNGLGGNDFVNSINLQKTAQPVVNYFKSSDAAVARSGLVGGGFQQYSAPLPNFGPQSGLGFTTASPLLSSGLGYSTASPLLNLGASAGSPLLSSGFSNAAPFLGSGLSYPNSGPFVGSSFGPGLRFANAGPLSAYNFNPASFGNFQSGSPVVSTTASSLEGLGVSTPSPLSVPSPESISVSSNTPAPILGLIKNNLSADISENLVSGDGSSTVAPEVYSGRVIGNSASSPIFEGSSPVALSTYGPPLSQK